MALPKPYFNVADFAKLLGLKPESLYVALNRLVKAGILRRLRRGIYEVVFSPSEPEEIASQLYWPCYLSFESALARYGIMDQLPYVLTFATPKRSKKIQLAGKEIEYRRIKKDLFFGYKKDGRIFVAEPEKALLDQAYLFSLGKASFYFQSWDLRGLKKERIFKYLKVYPQRVKKLIKEIF